MNEAVKHTPTSAGPAQPYQWGHVPIGSGGYITGIVGHPSVPELLYIRTDVGGAYRWDAGATRWIPLLDWITADEANLYGVESIALDAADGQRVYLGCGKYATNEPQGQQPGPMALLRSVDHGRSWARVTVPFRIEGNSVQRWGGERLVVDPHQGNILFYGTRYDGLWTSHDAGTTWHPVTSLPASGPAPYGVLFVAYDPASGTPGQPTPTLYVGVTGQGVYRSTDAGVSWALLDGGPTADMHPVHGVVAGGTFYLTTCTPNQEFSGSVWKYADDQWTEVTPRPGIGYMGLAVDPSNSNVVMVAQYVWGESRLFRSRDGGARWAELIADALVDPSSLPWYRRPIAQGTSQIVIDSANTNRVWLVDGFVVWRTDDVQQADAGHPTHWTLAYNQGIEETVVWELKSPPVCEAALLSAIGDVDGFCHTSLTTYPTEKFGGPPIRHGTSIDYAGRQPNVVARVGGSWRTGVHLGGCSTDGGRTWEAFAALPFPDAKEGQVVVGADGKTIVWVPVDSPPYYTTNGGASWRQSVGTPSGLFTDFWQWHRPIAADRVDGARFYLYHAGIVYLSTDGAATFTPVTDSLPVSELGEKYSLKALPGRAGEVWFSCDHGGLYRSCDGGNHFSQLPGVAVARLFAFGKTAPSRTEPTVFVYGTVNGRSGIFRSDDLGEQWIKIDQPEQPVGNDPLTMEGDGQIYGRVFIGTFGRGIFYGQPKDVQP